jgi:hypothetical protein
LRYSLAVHFLKRQLKCDVTMNDDSESAANAVSREFTFRGIDFFFPPDSKTAPPCARPGSKTRKKLPEALESFGESNENWSFRHAVFWRSGGYASSVLGVVTHPYYYAYKYVRRRHRLLAQGVIFTDKKPRKRLVIHRARGVTGL